MNDNKWKEEEQKWVNITNEEAEEEDRKNEEMRKLGLPLEGVVRISREGFERHRRGLKAKLASDPNRWLCDACLKIQSISICPSMSTGKDKLYCLECTNDFIAKQNN